MSCVPSNGDGDSNTGRHSLKEALYKCRCPGSTPGDYGSADLSWAQERNPHLSKQAGLWSSVQTQSSSGGGAVAK